MKSQHKQAVLAIIIANIIWGASFPIYKWSLENVPPFTFVFLRFFLGSLLVLPFTIHNLHIARKDLKLLFALSLSGITFAISCLFLGLQSAPSINAPIILSASPILLIFFAIFYMNEKPRRKVILGTLVSLLGVFLIILRPLFEGGFQGSIMGNLFLVMAMFGSVVHTILLKKIVTNYSALTITFWSFIIGSLPLLPLVFLEAQTQPILMHINGQGLIGIMYGAILSSALAHALIAYGIKYIQTSEVGIFTYVDPVATVMVAIPLLGEHITFTYFVAVLFVFLGIFIAEGRLHWHPLHRLYK